MVKVAASYEIVVFTVAHKKYLLYCFQTLPMFYHVGLIKVQKSDLLESEFDFVWN